MFPYFSSRRRGELYFRDYWHALNLLNSFCETFARMPSSPDIVVVAASDPRTCFSSQTRNVVDHRISRHGFKSLRIPAAHFDQLTQDPQSFSALYAIE